MLTRDYYMGLISDSGDPTWCHQMGLAGDDPASEFWLHVHDNTPSEGVRQVLAVTYGITGYDPKRVKTEGCQCLQCTQIQSDPDPNCLYAGMDTSDRVLASLDPDLLRKYWDLPYYLYALALAHADAAYKKSLWQPVVENDAVSETEKRNNEALAKLKSFI